MVECRKNEICRSDKAKLCPLVKNRMFAFVPAKIDGCSEFVVFDENAKEPQGAPLTLLSLDGRLNSLENKHKHDHGFLHEYIGGEINALRNLVSKMAHDVNQHEGLL